MSVKLKTLQVGVLLGGCILLAACSNNTSSGPDSGRENTPDGTDKPVKISAFSNFVPRGDAPEVRSWNDQMLWNAIPERTGVEVEWEHVSADYEAQLGLLIASGDLPDLMTNVSPLLAGQYGVQGALMPLQDLIAEYAPNLMSRLEANPEIRGQITAPDGNIYFFPRLLLDAKTQYFNGWTIRQSWVEETGMAMPGNLDELYDVLKAMKENNPNRYPFVFDPRVLIWEFGVGSRGVNNPTDFFVEDKVLKYGPTDPRFKEALTYLHKLYSEGLLDREYLTVNSATSDEGLAKITQEVGGFAYGSWAGVLTRFNQLLESEGKNGDFVAMRPPGEGNLFGRHNMVDGGNTGGVISVRSEHAVAITRMMDYLYSDEGRILLYYGIAGDTYEMVDGKPQPTDKVTGASIGTLNFRNIYIGDQSTWPSELPVDMYVNTLTHPEAVKGNEEATEYANDIKLPNLQFTTEERERVQEIQRDLNTYVDEHLHAFIMGELPLASFDAFVEGVRGIGADELTELYNASYNRYKDIVNQ